MELGPYLWEAEACLLGPVLLRGCHEQKPPGAQCCCWKHPYQGEAAAGSYGQQEADSKEPGLCSPLALYSASCWQKQRFAEF